MCADELRFAPFCKTKNNVTITLIDHAKKMKTPFCLLPFDAEKAFNALIGNFKRQPYRKLASQLIL